MIQAQGNWKDVRHGQQPTDFSRRLVGDEQSGAAFTSNKADV